MFGRLWGYGFLRFQRFKHCGTLESEINGGCLRNGLVLREKFTTPTAFNQRIWYPLHMSVQLKVMEAKLRSVDLIIEVHDARVPITGRNPHFYSKLYAIRPHILVMNKMDLIDLSSYRSKVETYYRENNISNLVWTNCKQRLSNQLKQLQNKILECLNSEPRYNRTVKTEYQVMVVGIPNVGKSALINSLRLRNLGVRKTAAPEGNQPGVTKRVQNRTRIFDRPPIYILDTPGVLYPKARNIDDSMKLALCNLVLESATELHYVADFLLYWLNRRNDFSYVEQLGLSIRPTDDILELLTNICKSQNLIRKCYIPGEGQTERWDIDKAAKLFIDMYRGNKFRDSCLDSELLEAFG